MRVTAPKQTLAFCSALLAVVSFATLANAQSTRPTNGTIDTWFNKIELENGFPTQPSIEKLYEEFDYQRAVQKRSKKTLASRRRHPPHPAANEELDELRDSLVRLRS